jgi:crossover junction endodeoxyribonuclease RuvC
MPRLKPDSIYIGVDPGKSGGLCAIFNDGSSTYCKMPDTERGVWNWFADIDDKESNSVHAIIEKVHAMPGQGVTSMFSFGQNYGFLRACLIGCHIPFEEVTPRSWQKALGIPAKPKSSPKNQHKLTLLSKAQQLFPQESLWEEPRSKGKQLAICDALLIAEYCRRFRDEWN